MGHEYQMTFDGDYQPLQEYSVKQLIAATDEALSSSDRAKLAWLMHPEVNKFIEFIIPRTNTAAAAREEYIKHLEIVQCFETFSRSARDVISDNSKTTRSLQSKRVPRWYPVYLATDHWNRIRSQVQEYYRTCVLCNESSVEILDTHHKHYRCLGKERIWELSLLCRTCHKNAHGFLDVKVPRELPDPVKLVFMTEGIQYV